MLAKLQICRTHDSCIQGDIGLAPHVRHWCKNKHFFNVETLTFSYGEEAPTIQTTLCSAFLFVASKVAKALDLQLAGCEFKSRPRLCRVTILGKLFTPMCLSRSQWFSDGMIDCGVRGHGQLCLSRQTLRCTLYSLGHGLRTLPAVPRSTQPSTLRGMVKWISAFGLSNNNKWRWWMWMVAAIYWRTHSPSR